MVKRSVQRHNTYSEKIRIALIFSLFLLLPFFAHATLSSSHYTLSNYSIGTTGNTMSSSQYSLTPSQGSVITQSGTSTGTSSSTGSSHHGHGTSTRKDFEDEPNEQDVILDTHTDRPDIHIEAPHGTVFNTKDLERRNIERTSDEKEDDVANESDSNTENQKEQKIDRSRLVASLISGDLHNVLGSLKEMFVELSRHFYARLGVFVGVLLMLYVLRMYTVFGRRFSPF